MPTLITTRERSSSSSDNMDIKDVKVGMKIKINDLGHTKLSCPPNHSMTVREIHVIKAPKYDPYKAYVTTDERSYGIWVQFVEPA